MYYLFAEIIKMENDTILNSYKSSIYFVLTVGNVHTKKLQLLKGIK